MELSEKKMKRVLINEVELERCLEFLEGVLEEEDED